MEDYEISIDNKEIRSIKELIPNIVSSGIIPYEYNKIKSKKYDKIIKYYFKNKKPQEQPIMFHMCGIPAAGKTTYYNNNKNEYTEYVFVAFDDVIEHIDEYNKDKRKDSVKAFKKWEMTARIIGYEILRIAVENKYNIFFDHGGLNEGHKFLLENVKKYGYKVKVHVIQCEPRGAFVRGKRRESTTKRHLPLQLIINRFLMLPSQIKNFEKIADECSGNTEIVESQKRKQLLTKLFEEIFLELVTIEIVEYSGRDFENQYKQYKRIVDNKFRYNVVMIDTAMKELPNCLSSLDVQESFANAILNIQDITVDDLVKCLKNLKRDENTSSYSKGEFIDIIERFNQDDNNKESSKYIFDSSDKNECASNNIYKNKNVKNVVQKIVYDKIIETCSPIIIEEIEQKTRSVRFEGLDYKLDNEMQNFNNINKRQFEESDSKSDNNIQYNWMR